MIYEQAFYHLPEILFGKGYKEQAYEGGIVGAFGLAILQVLNGKNVANPISCLVNEKLYLKGGFKVAGRKKPRKLRCDILLDTAALNVYSDELYEYGWRHNNWLEAKFFRNEAKKGSNKSPNNPKYAAGLLGDLLRLCALVPEQSVGSTVNSRYLLHVYDASPKAYISNPSTVSWADAICETGDISFKINNLSNLSQTMKDSLGDFSLLDGEFFGSNLRICSKGKNADTLYYILLTRIDKYHLGLATGERFEINLDGKIIESSTGDFSKIQSYVAANLISTPIKNKKKATTAAKKKP